MVMVGVVEEPLDGLVMYPEVVVLLRPLLELVMQAHQQELLVLVVAAAVEILAQITELQLQAQALTVETGL
jgi:hypothetical protein